MDYVFGCTWQEVGICVSSHSCEEFRTSWNDVPQHFRFSNLVFEGLKLIAEEQNADDIVAYERNIDSAHFIMASRLYCRLLPRLQQFMLECIEKFQIKEASRE